MSAAPGRRRIVVLGPAHPSKGGIAVHTTELARHLAQGPDADVKLVSWAKLYPELLYPGEVALPDATPEVPEFTPTLRRCPGPRRRPGGAPGGTSRRPTSSSSPTSSRCRSPRS